MSSQQFTQLQLPDCCRTALRQMHDRIEAAEALKKVLAASPFLAIFSDSPPFVIYSLIETDWQLFGTAVKSVATIGRDRAQLVAQLHGLEHPGGELHGFWKAMYESFG